MDRGGIARRISFSVLLLQVIWLTRLQVAAVDKGFELFFKTQKATFHNVTVKFESPVPEWLKGIYVS